MSTLLLAGCGVLLVLLRVAWYFRAPSALGFNVVLHPLCGDWPSLRSSGPTMSLSSRPALLAADAVSSLYRFRPVRPLLTSAHLPASHSAASASLGLKKAHFAMPPRWLKPTERVNTDYSTITFAISDPDGSITSALLNGRAALFGKEVIIQRWVDKPALVQCSHCHALGHIRTSRACPLGKDSVKCFICGGSHQSDTHDQKCPRKHAVAGICDCKHFKCLNCHNTGHNCKDTRCPARDLFQPRASRRPRKPRNKGKERQWAPDREPSIVDSDEDLYRPAPLPQNPTGRQIRTVLHNRSIANLCRMSSRSRVDENNASGSNIGLSYDAEEFPEVLNHAEPMDTDLTRLTEYSPSQCQGDVTEMNLA